MPVIPCLHGALYRLRASVLGVWATTRRVLWDTPLFLSQAAAPALRETRGLIINMVDIHARRPLRAHPVYSAAKAGLVMLTKSLARELGLSGEVDPDQLILELENLKRDTGARR